MQPRFDDSPPPVPRDAPQAVDDFGTTTAEEAAMHELTEDEATGG